MAKKLEFSVIVKVKDRGLAHCRQIVVACQNVLGALLDDLLLEEILNELRNEEGTGGEEV